MNDPTIERITDALRAGTAGYHSGEAAVELLSGHGIWPRKYYFRDRFIELFPDDNPADDPDLDPGPEYVMTGIVRWAEAVAALEAGDLPCSTSEAAVLRIAASIGAGTPVDLRGALGGLDGGNLRLVLAALAHANGGRGAQVSIR